MNKVLLGILLILMMFGHNYVLNQPQVLQAQFQQIHQISVPQFNLLYSVPSAVAIFFILPLGIMYDSHAQIILLGSGFGLMLGQLLVAIFGTNNNQYAFPLLTLGRVLEGTTAEVLYMIQANLSSTWMGKLAGLTLILPEVGEIANVFLTLEMRQKFGVLPALIVGFITCFISFIACLFLFREIKRHKKIKGSHQIMVHSPQIQDQGDKDFNMIEDGEDVKSMQSIDINKAAKISSIEIENEKHDQKKQLKQKHSELNENPRSIFKAGEIFWLVVVLCAINECLYFPFLDNAKVLIQTRFCVPQQKTGFYLCLPYLSAIIVSFIVGEQILYKYSRHKLIFFSSLLPLIGHLTIYVISNCDTETTYFEQTFLILGFVFFGMGIAGYYSVSMPAVGLSVPQNIRGTAFASLGFFQTLTMTAVPLLSGYIIQEDTSNYRLGYRDSSFLFVCLCLTASVVSFYIMLKAKPDSFKYVDEELKQENVIEIKKQDTQSSTIV